MIFLVQFGINVHLYIFFLRPQIALALWDRTILSLKKFTPAYLFQISLEIMWLTKQMNGNMESICQVDNVFK